MILVDGNLYSLKDEEIKEFGRKIIWHVPPKPFDLKNRRHGIPAGVGIPNVYVKLVGGRQVRVTYFTREEWNEDRKRKEYYVDNTGPQIIFGDKGKIVSENAEFNWFMHYNPHNNGNPLREDDYSNPYKDKPVLFHQYNPSKSARYASDIFQAKRDLYEIFALDGRKSWSDGDIVLACKTLCTTSEMHLPHIIVEWKEYKDEEGVEVLRNGLMSLADREPLTLKAAVVTGRRNIINRTVQQCIEHAEVTGFKYNVTQRTYSYTDEKGKEIIFLEVPEKKDPDKFILDTLTNDHKKVDKLSKLLDRVLA